MNSLKFFRITARVKTELGNKFTQMNHQDCTNTSDTRVLIFSDAATQNNTSITQSSYYSSMKRLHRSFFRLNSEKFGPKLPLLFSLHSDVFIHSEINRVDTCCVISIIIYPNLYLYDTTVINGMQFNNINQNLLATE